MRRNVAVTQGGEGIATEIDGLDTTRALSFLLDIETFGQVRPVKERKTDGSLGFQVKTLRGDTVGPVKP